MVLKRLFPVMLLACSAGCLTSLSGAHVKPELDPSASDPLPPVNAPQAAPNPTVARSQIPPLPPSPEGVVPATLVMPAPTVPVTRLSTDPNLVNRKPDPQVRIVAQIGATPIYDQEVREAMYQRHFPELANLTGLEQKQKEKEFYKAELKRVIERELILEDMKAMLKSQKRQSMVEELEKGTNKEADMQMKQFRKAFNTAATDSEFKIILGTLGLTMEGVHRNFARGAMLNIFMNEQIKTRVKNIGLADLKDYYQQHQDLFQTKDRVKWQDMVLYKEARRYTIDPRQYCEILAARARKGEDFEKLVALFDHRNLKTVDGAGEEKGKIYPPEVEPTVLAMNPGEVNIVEMESCFHIVRVVERTHVGLRPFTDLKLQLEIHKRLEFEIGESEYRKLADGLWAKGQPTILIDLEK